MSDSESPGPEEVLENDSPARPITPRTVKNMPDHMWNAIVRAAKANGESVAEYLWAAHEIRRSWHSPPPPLSTALTEADGHTEVILRDDRQEPRLPPRPFTSLVELMELICKVASTKPSFSNRALLNEARQLLSEKLREARNGLLPHSE